jgi:carboxyl-terminal processing protease
MKSGISAGMLILLAQSSGAPAAGAGLTGHVGVWRMQGYGVLLDVSGTGVIGYDLTDISCTLDERYSPEEAAEEYDRATVIGDRLELYKAGGITRYGLERIAALPESCRNGGNTIADPVLNFWVMWHAIRENYAFFALRGVDWNEIYARYRPQVSAETSEERLFDIFRAMLAELDDMHVELKAGERTFFTNGPVEELKAIWLAEREGRTWEKTEAEYKAAVRRFIHDTTLHGKAGEGAQETITWGWAAPGVGYINIAAMYLQPPLRQDGSPGEPYSLPDELAMVDEAMTRALRDLNGAKAMIVDARFNDGGADAFALRILGYLTRERLVAFTKKAVHGTGHTEAQPVYIEPVGASPFLGPVSYLQSGSTISAAEIFSLGMMALPNVTMIGTRTYGVLSDVLSKPLPNGWDVGMSNEIYTAVDGKVYEGIGIPPDVVVPVAPGMSFERRLKLDIDAALGLATPPRIDDPRAGGTWRHSDDTRPPGIRRSAFRRP